MKTCKTCAYWKGQDFQNYGYRKCTHDSVDSGGLDGCAITDGDLDDTVSFYTGPNFGCVHHEPKE